jgi:serine/threonine protein kinase
MWYKEEELFLILYELAAGIKEFQIRGLHFGDIRPSQMVITSSTKKIKMITTYSFPWEMTSIDKILEKYDNTTKFYLAPEEIQFVSSPSRTSNLPSPKTEAFSLGLTILEAAILQNSEDLYTVNPRSINMQLLEKRLVIL